MEIGVANQSRLEKLSSQQEYQLPRGRTLAGTGSGVGS